MKIYIPSLEERAFLYQNALALQPLVKDLGSLSLVVEETEGKAPRYRVTFMVAPESVGMQIQAESLSLYDATVAAKDEAERQLNALVNELPATVPPETLH